MNSKLPFWISVLILSGLILGGCVPAFSNPVPTNLPTVPVTQNPVIPTTEQVTYKPVVTITPTNGSVGTPVQIFASGFAPNTPVSVGMGPVNAGFGIVAEGVTDANGIFITSVPAQGAPGMQLVFAVSAENQPGVLATEQFQITEPVPNPQTNPPSATLTPYLDMWIDYSNPVFAVSLQYPSDWQPDPGYGSLESGETRYAGITGFFQISAMDTESIDMAAASEAGHKLQPYGPDPSIESLYLQGQEARLILPSGNQFQAGLIIQYPQPVNISGTPCRYLIMWADKAHIQTLAETIRFLE